jgi:hypothetical protein
LRTNISKVTVLYESKLKNWRIIFTMTVSKRTSFDDMAFFKNPNGNPELLYLSHSVKMPIKAVIDA